MNTSPPRTRRFRSRLYPYGQTNLAADAVGEIPQQLPAKVLHRFVMGRDTRPQPLSVEEAQRLLRDPFASLLLRRGEFPLTLQQLLASLDKFNSAPQALAEQKVYMVADGGQIPWTPETANLDRQFRLAISRGVPGQLAMVFVSTSTEVASSDTFLQVIGWDPDNQVYHWYDRRGSTWIWAGNSWDSLAPDSRGHGPFDSHVNGSINMKELKLPWPSWHSQNATIRAQAFAPDDPFVKSNLFQSLTGAQVFEMEVARPGIARWQLARRHRLEQNGILQRFPEFLRQVLASTTVNLTCSSEQSSQLSTGQPLVLPSTLFIDADALFSELDFGDNIVPIQVDGGLYQETLQKLAVSLRDDSVGFSMPGEGFFACIVPERSLEDLTVVQSLLGSGDENARVLSDRLAACLLMVDFSNPVFSARRAALTRYAPDSAAVGHPEELEDAFVNAVAQAAKALPPASPEREFLSNWSIPADHWRSVFETRIEQYFDALQIAAGDPGQFADIYRLIDSRRREFRRRPLAEFDLTMPASNVAVDAPFLEMTAEARVREKS